MSSGFSPLNAISYSWLNTNNAFYFVSITTPGNRRPLPALLNIFKKKKKRQGKRHAKLKKQAPHYSTSKPALTEALELIRRVSLGWDGLFCSHPACSMSAISSSQSGINVQHTPEKIYNTSNNNNNLQPLRASILEVWVKEAVSLFTREADKHD